MARPRKRGISGSGSIYRRESDGRWVASFIAEETGKRRYLYADKDDNTQQNAYKKLQNALFEQRQGKLATGPRQTLKQFLEKWFEDVHKFEVRETTYQRHLDILRLYLLPTLGHLQIQKLAPQQVQNLYSEMAKRGLKPGTIRITHSVLHKALKQAVAWNLVARNACDAVTLPKMLKYQPQMLTRDQVIALFKRSKGHRLEAFIWLGLTLGLRHGELRALRWSDIDMEKRTVRIERKLYQLTGRDIEGDPKTSKSKRTIILPLFLVESLKQHRERQLVQRAKAGDAWQENNLVFCGPKGNFGSRRRMVKSMKLLLKEIGLPDMRVHDLRHNASTFLQMVLRMPAKMVQDILGHDDLEMTFDYTHTDLDAQRAMMDEFDQFFNRLSDDDNDNSAGSSAGRVK